MSRRDTGLELELVPALSSRGRGSSVCVVGAVLGTSSSSEGAEQCQNGQTDRLQTDRLQLGQLAPPAELTRGRHTRFCPSVCAVAPLGASRSLCPQCTSWRSGGGTTRARAPA